MFLLFFIILFNIIYSEFIPNPKTITTEVINIYDSDDMSKCTNNVCNDISIDIINDFDIGFFGQLYIDGTLYSTYTQLSGNIGNTIGPICLSDGDHVIKILSGVFYNDTSIKIYYSITQEVILPLTYIGEFTNTNDSYIQVFHVVVNDLDVAIPDNIIMGYNSGLSISSIMVIHNKLHSDGVVQVNIYSDDVKFTLNQGNCYSDPYVKAKQLYNNITLKCDIDNLNMVLSSLVLNSYEIGPTLGYITVSVDDLGNTLNGERNIIKKDVGITFNNLYCSGIIIKTAPGIIRDRRVDSTTVTYADNSFCQFYLHDTYLLKSISMDLDDDSIDYIKVYKGNTLTSPSETFYHNDNIRVTSGTGEMIVEFKSNKNNEKNGFVLYFSGIIEDYGDCVIELELPSITNEYLNEISSILTETFSLSNENFQITNNDTFIQINLYEIDGNSNSNINIGYTYESLIIMLESDVFKMNYEVFNKLIDFSYETFPRKGCNNGYIEKNGVIPSTCSCTKGFQGERCTDIYEPICNAPCYSKSNENTDCCIEIGDNVIIYSNYRLVHYNPNTYSYAALTETNICLEDDTSYYIELNENGYLEALPDGNIVTIYKNALYKINGDTGYLMNKLFDLPFNSEEYGVNRYLYDEEEDEWYILCVNTHSIYHLDNNGTLIEPSYFTFPNENSEGYYSMSLTDEYITYERSEYKYFITYNVEYDYIPQFNKDDEEKCYILPFAYNSSVFYMEKIGTIEDTTPVMIISDSTTWYYMHPSFGIKEIKSQLDGYKEGVLTVDGSIAVLDSIDKSCYSLYPNGDLRGTPRWNESYTHLDSGKPYSMAYSKLSNIIYWSDNNGPYRISAMSEKGEFLGFLGLTFGDFGSAGSLVVRPSAYAPNCYATDIISEGRAGELITVKIHARNKIYEPWEYPAHFEIELKTFSTVGDKTVEYTFQGEVLPTNESDVYIGQFVVELAQEYSVYIYHTNLKIKIDGIPYKYLSLPSYTDPSASTASGEGLEKGVAGDDLVFTVTACDRFGNIRDSGNDEIKILVGGEEIDTMDIVDNLNGTYTVTYNVTQARSYIIEIFIKGGNDEYIEIDKSPWTVVITPRDIEPTHSEILNSGIEEVLVNSEMNINVVLRDEFDNIIPNDIYIFEVVIFADTVAITNTTHTISGDGIHRFTFFNPYEVDLNARVRVEGYRIGKDQSDQVFVPIKYKENIIKRSEVVAILFQAIAVLFLIIELTCLGFLIKYHKHRILIMSQWEMLVSLILGAIIVDIGLIVYCVNITQTSCGTYILFVQCGYVLEISTLLIKYWRSYYVIQLDTKKKKRRITKTVIFELIIAINLAYFFILVIILSANPYKPTLITGKNKLEGVVTIQELVYICQCKYDFVFRYLYMAVILIFCGLTFYYNQSLIKILEHEHTDGSIIKYSLVNVMIMVLIGFVIEDILNSTPDLSFILYFITMIIGSNFTPIILIALKYYNMLQYNKEKGDAKTTQFDDDNLTLFEPKEQLGFTTTTTTATGNAETIEFLDKLRVWQQRMFRQDLTQEQFEKLTRQLIRIVEVITGKSSGLSRRTSMHSEKESTRDSNSKSSIKTKTRTRARNSAVDKRGSLNGQMFSKYSKDSRRPLDPSSSYSVLDIADTYFTGDFTSRTPLETQRLKSALDDDEVNGIPLAPEPKIFSLNNLFHVNEESFD